MEQTIQNKRDTELTRRIMRRIYLIAVIRMFLHPVFLKSLIVAVFFWRSTAYVSYAHVIANAPSFFDIRSDVTFYGSALMQAEAATIALLFAIGALLIWISFDMIHKRTQAWI